MAYAFSRTITIDHTLVAGDLINFPFLFRGTETGFRTVANGGSVHSSSGFDIIFSSDSAGTSILNFEIATWDAAKGILVAWVQIPSLSSTVDTVIYLLYGNASVTTPQSPALPWDSNYKVVAHLQSTAPDATNPNGTVSGIDSTANANNFTATGTVLAAPGWIQGEGANFPGAGEYMSAPNAIPIQNLGTGPMTVEFWALGVDTQPLNFDAVISKEGNGTAGWSVQFGEGKIWFERIFTGGLYDFSASLVAGSNILHHYVVAFDGASSCSIYGDGASLSVTPSSASGTQPTDAAIPLQFSTSDTTFLSVFKGTLNEIRISNIQRSSAYAETSFNTQSIPQRFYTIGVPITASNPTFPATTVPPQADDIYQPFFPPGPLNSVTELKPSNSKNGPFVIGSNLYQVGVSIGTTGAPGQVPNRDTSLVVEKSSDGGRSWAAKDITGLMGLGFPLAESATFQRVFTSRVQGTFIYVVYVGALASNPTVANGIYVGKFDTTTDAWVSVTSAIPGIDPVTNLYIQPNFGFSVPADGFYNVVIYLIGSPFNQNIFKFTYSAGSWGSAVGMPFPFGIAPNPPTFIGWDVNPANNDMYCWATQRRDGVTAWPDGRPNGLFVTILHSDGVWESDPLHPSSGGSTAVVTMMYNNSAPFTYPSCVDSMAFLPNGAIVVSLQCAEFVSGDANQHTSYGASMRPAIVSFAGGSWTGFSILSLDNADLVFPGGNLWGTCTAVVGNTAYVFWTANNLNGTDFSLQAVSKLRYCTTTDGLSFSSPATAYDSQLNPPPNYVDANFGATNQGAAISQGIYQPNVAVVGTAFYFAFSYGAYFGDESVQVYTGRAFFSVGVTSPPISLACGSPPVGKVGVPYSSPMVLTNATAPITASIISGQLPAGLSLNISGASITIEGTPLLVGTFTFTVQVTDSTEATASVTCSIPITAPIPVGVTCAIQSVALIGQTYSSRVNAYGGTGPYTFSITSGSLPPGLTLNTSTGTITGTPTTAGTFPYTITATDSLGATGSSSCQIVIAACPGAL